MKVFILDIETKPDEKLVKVWQDNLKYTGTAKDPAKIEKAMDEKKKKIRKKMSTDPDYCEIICIGIKEYGKEPALYDLKDMAQWFKDQEGDGGEGAGMLLITFNGKAFDLPVLIKAGLRNKIDLPYRPLYAACGKYNHEGHIDLMQTISFNSGLADAKTKDLYNKIYLGIDREPKTDEWFEKATEDEIREHCLEDLEDTERLFKRVRRLL